MSIGFAVDLSAHIVYAFVTAHGDVHGRVIGALEHLGWPIFQVQLVFEFHIPFCSGSSLDYLWNKCPLHGRCLYYSDILQNDLADDDYRDDPRIVIYPHHAFVYSSRLLQDPRRTNFFFFFFDDETLQKRGKGKKKPVEIDSF